MSDIAQLLTGWNCCRLCNKKLYFKKFMGKKYVLNQEYLTLIDDVYLMTCKDCFDVHI